MKIADSRGKSRPKKLKKDKQQLGQPIFSMATFHVANDLESKLTVGSLAELSPRKKGKLNQKFEPVFQRLENLDTPCFFTREPSEFQAEIVYPREASRRKESIKKRRSNKVDEKESPKLKKRDERSKSKQGFKIKPVASFVEPPAEISAACLGFKRRKESVLDEKKVEEVENSKSEFLQKIRE